MIVVLCLKTRQNPVNSIVLRTYNTVSACFTILFYKIKLVLRFSSFNSNKYIHLLKTKNDCLIQFDYFIYEVLIT